MLFDSLRQRMMRMTRRLADRRTTRRASGCKPLLEALEDRCLLSTAFVVTNVNDSGPGSLRQAITDSNANPDPNAPNLIDFNIPGTGVHTIFVGSTTHQSLPTLEAVTEIDGYSQPGASPNKLSVGDNAVLKIELDGSKLGLGHIGLDLASSQDGVAGLMIDNFRSNGTLSGGSAILAEASENDIFGNFLGLHGSGGPGTFSNGSDMTVGVGSSENFIGNTTPESRNVFSGAVAGVTILGANGFREFNQIQNNYIGTDPTGTRAVPNENGVFDEGANNNIGLSITSDGGFGVGNVISGNLRTGVNLSGALNETITGNLIGVNAQGTLPLSNGGVGIFVSGGSGTVIGGSAANILGGTAANVIGGGIGIELTDQGGVATSGYQILDNFIGTDPTFTHNFRGNVGIDLDGETATLGVTNTTISGNVIVNQSLIGVEIFGAGAANNVVTGNFIGTNTTHTLALGNGIGVEALRGAHNNIIGVGGTATVGNVIAHNTGAAVQIGLGLTDATTVGNTVIGNSIFANGFGIGLGINGVIPNRTVNPSPGPNGFQNYPVLTSATVSIIGRTVVQGTLHSAPNASFVIDFYSSTTADKSGFGQGQFFLGRTTVTTNANGDATFSVTLTPGTLWGNVITATATEAGVDSTSEFSKAVTVLRSRLTLR